MGDNRVVTLIDMDCFYCQVEEKINPDLKDKPIAVVQYNEWKGGGIIAVNYLARAKGVTRFMRGDEAKEICPDIALPKVPCVRGKADISKYRDAGKDVARVLQRFTPLLERASIDEAYLDITQVVNERISSNRHPHSIIANNLPNTYVLGFSSIEDFISNVYKDSSSDHDLFNFDQKHALQLLTGAIIVSEIRAAVYEATGYRCSAGIAHNKIMAKLVCGMNKPNKQTLLPLDAVSAVFELLPINKIKSLGGKFGQSVCEVLKITKMKELLQFSEKDLQKCFDDKNGTWLYNIAKGIDNEPVTPRFTSKTIGCCKKFAGKNAILNLASLVHWLNELGDEIEDRLKEDLVENNRNPTQIVVSFTKQLANGKDVSCSRSINVKRGNDLCGKALAEHSLLLIKKDSKPFSPAECQGIEDTEKILLSHPVKYLGISVGKFEEITHSNKGKSIVHFFGQTLPSHGMENENSGSVTVEGSNQNNSALPLSSKEELPHSTNIDVPVCETKLITQESFFINFFKSTDKKRHSASDSKAISDEIVSNSEIPITNIKDNPISPRLNINSTSILDDSCNSNDSECTIDLEINRSKQLVSCDEINLNISERPSVPRNFSNFDDKIEEPTDENSQIDDNIACPECNKSIPVLEYSTHSDYHVALSIRQQERRSIQKPVVKLATAQPEQCKKKSSSTSVENKHNSITAFFGKLSNNDEDDSGPKEKCFECGKQIKLSEFSEHLDYHEAKKLSLEINKPLLNKFSDSIGKRKLNTKDDHVVKKDKKENNKPNISKFFCEKK